MAPLPALSRRHFLTAAGAGAAATLLPEGLARAATPTPAQLSDVEHVVILMQENRSFDHYFGTLRGVRGFDDPTAAVQASGQSIFYQPDPLVAKNAAGQDYILPWHHDTTLTNCQSAADLSHAWAVQHDAYNQGLMNGWVPAHRTADDYGVNTNNAPFTMGYYTRNDIPWHFALADSYTLCDNYFCSVLGPTHPNRIMLMSATIDPDGTMGGPCLDNSQTNGQLTWQSYPERLQQAGIDWYLYQESDNYGTNMLPYFAAFSDKTTAYGKELNRRGNSVIPSMKNSNGQTVYGPGLAAKLKADVMSGNLPQVSWICGAAANSEHPTYTPANGAAFIASVLSALQSNPAVWAKTVFFVNYDENDGRFDHVIPQTAPPGTPGEFVTSAVANSTVALEASDGTPGPVGLGVRVPMFVVSPLSRGGLLSSKPYDHTSTLLFLEKRFGVEVPNLSAWRRGMVGDLTDAINFAGGVDLSAPNLPDAQALAVAAAKEATLPPATMPTVQSMPTQEKGAARAQPSGLVAGVAPALPEVGLPALLPLAGVAAAAAFIVRSRGSRKTDLSQTDLGE